MNCEKCGAAMSGLSKEEPGVRSAVCTSGHRIYFYLRDDGAWETAKQKMDRMRKKFFCRHCGEKVITYTDPQHDLRTCDGCLREQTRSQSEKQRKQGVGRAEGRRIGTSRSPWKGFRPGGLNAG